MAVRPVKISWADMFRICLWRTKSIAPKVGKQTITGVRSRPRFRRENPAAEGPPTRPRLATLGEILSTTPRRSIYLFFPNPSSFFFLPCRKIYNNRPAPLPPRPNVQTRARGKRELQISPDHSPRYQYYFRFPPCYATIPAASPPGGGKAENDFEMFASERLRCNERFRKKLETAKSVRQAALHRPSSSFCREKKKKTKSRWLIGGHRRDEHHVLVCSVKTERTSLESALRRAPTMRCRVAASCSSRSSRCERR